MIGVRVAIIYMVLIAQLAEHLLVAQGVLGSSPSPHPQILINIMNTELQKSAELMLSADYKERFVAEYMQIDNRLRGLKKMLNSWDEGTLTFTPACPRETYAFQVAHMQGYRDILVVRAKIEGIELPF